MTKKKRNKRYNPTARAIGYAKSYSKQFAIAWCGPERKAEAYKLKTMSRVLLKPSEAMALTQVTHKWKAHIVVILRDHTGRDYIQAEELVFPQELYSDEISDVVNEHMHAFIKSCNANHFVNTGWVATTSDTEITDEAISKMMDNLGAWDFLAKFEATEDSDPVVMKL